MFNAATIERIGRATLAVFFLAVLPVSLAEAVSNTTFGPQTFIGPNYQQTSSRWHSGDPLEGCREFPPCFVYFQGVGRHGLIIQNVSCMIVSINEILYVKVQSFKVNKGYPLRETYILPTTRDNTRWIVNSQIMHLVEAGERAHIAFYYPNGSFISDAKCTISGQIREP